MIKIIIAFTFLITMVACNETKKMNTPETKTTVPVADTAKQIVNISGKVEEIQNGKDGYTAKIFTTDNVIYFVTISIPNMSDPKDYRRVAVGDMVNVSGEIWKTETENHLTVRSMK